MQAKTFNLTFKGNVLPKYDHSKVKSDLATLLSIEDPSVINELFSGQTIILRQNLDRKTAAEYFRKINLLGGEVELVATNDYLAGTEQKVTKLDQKPGQPDRIERHSANLFSMDATLDPAVRSEDEPDQNWPVRTKAANPTTVEQTRGADGNESMAVSNTQRELNHLENLIEKTRRKSELESEQLQRRIGHFNRIAAQELAKIEDARSSAGERTEEKISELKHQDETMRLDGQAEILHIVAQQHESQVQADDQAERLEVEKAEKLELQKVAIETAEESRRDIGIKAEEEVSRLKRLIKETRNQAKRDIDQIDHQLSSVKSDVAAEIAAINTQHDHALNLKKEMLRELEQQQQAAAEQLESGLQDLQLKQKETLKQQQEELKRLRVMELDISTKREEGIKKIELDKKKVSRESERALQRFNKLLNDAKGR